MTQIAIPPAESLHQLASALSRLKSEGERIILEENGEPVAALISIEDLRLFEKLFEEEEDRVDLAAAEAALAEPGPNIPYEEIRKELGL